MRRRKHRTPVRRAAGFPLARLLEKTGFTKSRLSALSGIPRPMIFRLAKGESNPNWLTVRKIAKALGCSLGDFEEGGPA